MSSEANSPVARQGGGTTLAEGDTVTRQVVDGLTRTQIVQYAGASGDFNPIHTDEVFATQAAGRSSVIAHGMLTMGLTARALAETVDQESIRSFGGRFRAPVLPGDSITVVIRREPAEQVESDSVRLNLVASNQSGTAVFVGYATVAG